MKKLNSKKVTFLSGDFFVVVVFGVVTVDVIDNNN